MSEAYTIPQKLIRMPGKMFRRLRQDGPGNIVQWSLYQLSWRFRERRLEIDTREFSHGFQVGDDGQCVGYEPIADVTWLTKECNLPTGFWDHITCNVYQHLPG